MSGALVLNLLVPQAHAFEISEKVIVEAVPANLVVVVTKPSDNSRWLIRLNPGCSAFKKGQSTSLSIRGDLNGSDDFLTSSSDKKCVIKEAFEYNQALFVDYAYRNEIHVTDEQGKKWVFFHYEGCAGVRAYLKKHIYAYQFGHNLARGDKLFPPPHSQQCAIKHVEKSLDGREVISEPLIKNSTLPTRVTHVRAVPRNGKVYLYWKPAQDDVGVDHYIVSYSKDRYDPTHLTRDSAPNQQIAKGRLTKIDDLQNDVTYYFYLMAVDASNNASDLWSEPAEAHISSAIMPDAQPDVNPGVLNLRQISESNKSIVFKWERSPNAQRYSILLTANGEKEITRTGYEGSRLVIFKRSDLKEKKLKLTVSAFSERSFIKTETVEFEF
jgi:hypothetical protein